MSDLVFYTNPRSRGQIVHWMREEVGEPYETVWLDYQTDMKSPEYLAINPMPGRDDPSLAEFWSKR